MSNKLKVKQVSGFGEGMTPIFCDGIFHYEGERNIPTGWKPKPTKGLSCSNCNGINPLCDNKRFSGPSTSGYMPIAGQEELFPQNAAF